MDNAVMTREEAEVELEKVNDRLDELEMAMLGSEAEEIDLPLVHRFTPGLYAREIFMPAGTLCTSRVHRTEHPYVVMTGEVSVLIPGVGVQHIEAPYVGITKPGTRRLLYIHEDCIWITFHPLVEGESGPEDLGKIEERIIEKRLLPGGHSSFEMHEEKLKMQQETMEVGSWHGSERQLG